MESCWNENPEKRPSFEAICNCLEQFLGLAEEETMTNLDMLDKSLEEMDQGYISD